MLDFEDTKVVSTKQQGIFVLKQEQRLDIIIPRTKKTRKQALIFCSAQREGASILYTYTYSCSSSERKIGSQ